MGALAAAVLGLIGGVGLQGGDFVLGPGMGVELSQVDFHLAPSAPLVDSDFGVLSADPLALEAATGLGTGYLNLFLPRGHVLSVPPLPRVRGGTWAVQNLRIQAHTSLDLPAALLALGLSFPDQPRSTSTYFDLGVAPGTPVSLLRALLLYSATPVTSAADLAARLGAATPTPFRVLDRQENAGGGEEEVCSPAVTYPGGPLEPPPPPNSLAASFWIMLPNPANEQCAHNQCGPMSWANNLQYLEDTFGIVYQFSVPEVHAPGLYADGTLVGTLDFLMNRSTTTRCTGGGTNRCNKGANDLPSRIPGLMDYLAQRYDPARIDMRHQGLEAAFPDDCTGTFTFGIHSLQEGAMPTWEWIRDRIAEGYALSITYVRYDNPGTGCGFVSNGGHILRVSEVGSTLGLKQIATVDDGWQDSLVMDVCTPHDDLRDSLDWWLADLDGDGFLNLSGNRDWELELAVALRIRPPPAAREH